MNVNRRGFLKLLSAVAASAAMPVPTFVLAEPEVQIAAMPVELGMIRSMCVYDISKDLHLVRFDAMNGRKGEQLNVTIAVPPIYRKSDEQYVSDMRTAYLHERQRAHDLLRNEMIKREWMASDLMPLEMPPGVHALPQWMYSL